MTKRTSPPPMSLSAARILGLSGAYWSSTMKVPSSPTLATLPAAPASASRRHARPPRGVRHAYSGALAYFAFMKLW
jgi:hypothetical protein